MTIRSRSRIYYRSSTAEAGYDAARALLARPDPPTAIFVTSDLQAYGVIHAIHDQQLRAPDDVAVASFDGTVGSAHTWPPLTLVQQPILSMAEAGMDAILSRNPPAHRLFDMELCGAVTIASVRT